MYYPVMLQLEGKRCTVIGGGKVAERKIRGLLAYPVTITVISPKVTEVLQALWQEQRIIWIQEVYEPGRLAGSDLVFIATDSPEISRQCTEEARSIGALVNVVDLPQLSDFIVPAVHRQGDLVIGISTEGSSPLLARRIKEQIREIYGDRFKVLTKQLREIRSQALADIPEIQERGKLFEYLVEKGLEEGQEDLWHWYWEYIKGGEGSENR